MAVVNIDLSEYDMLREAKLKAEKTIEKLEQEMKDLKSSSKIILRREHTYLTPIWDERELECELQNRLRHFFCNFRYYDPIERGSDTEMRQLTAALASSFRAIKKQYKAVNPHTLEESTLPEKSDTLIGFEDIRLTVENLFKDQFKAEQESKLEDLKRQMERLKAKEKSLREELTAEYKEAIEDQKKKIEKAEEKNTELLAEISSLKSKIRELSMSNKEKLNIALMRLEEAKQEVAQLRATKRWSLFKR